MEIVSVKNLKIEQEGNNRTIFTFNLNRNNIKFVCDTQFGPSIFINNNKDKVDYKT